MKESEVSNTKKMREMIKSRLMEDLSQGKEGLELRISRVKERADSKFYKRKMDQLYSYIEDKGFPNGDRSQIMDMADFYQKIELFMEYDKEDYSEEEIYRLIAEVYKSMYVNFILYFLNAEHGETFPIPYIGDYRLHHTVTKTENVKAGKVHRFYGVLRMFKDVKDEIRRILNGDDTFLIDDAMEEIKQVLQDKMEE